jgi:hypothetical protein
MTAWHWSPGRPDRCHHRAHACGKSLTLAGWAHLAWLMHRENRRLDRMLRELRKAHQA